MVDVNYELIPQDEPQGPDNDDDVSALVGKAEIEPPIVRPPSPRMVSVKEHMQIKIKMLPLFGETRSFVPPESAFRFDWAIPDQDLIEADWLSETID
jgi:hypothetical protein